MIELQNRRYESLLSTGVLYRGRALRFITERISLLRVACPQIGSCLA